MTTGDIKNNIRKLISELKLVSYDCNAIDYDSLVHGIPSSFLPIIHYTFLDYSHHLASYLAKKNYELYARTDLRFIETVYKILMQEFSFKPNLTKEQFLALGFAERKIILLTNIVRLCREKSKSTSYKKENISSIAKSQLRNNQNLKKITKNQDITSNRPEVLKGGQLLEDFIEGGKIEMAIKDDVDAYTNKDVASSIYSEIAESGNFSLSSLPSLDVIMQSNLSIDEMKIPKPCDSLALTPLKCGIGATKTNIGTSNSKSRAEVLEIEDVEPSGFKVINHNTHREKKVTSGIFELAGDDATMIQSKNIETEAPKPFATANREKKDSFDVSEDNFQFDKKTKNHDCKCKDNRELLVSLQDTVESLEKSLKNVVVMNNELSARVVLLETRNKLMEEKIESMTLTAESETSQQQSESKRETKTVVKEWKQNSRSLMQGDVEIITNEKPTFEYSSNRYADYEESLPKDFEPIRIRKISPTNADEKQSHGLSPNQDNHNERSQETALDRENLLAKITESMKGQDGEDQVETEIVSPLAENKFSFMEDNTRKTVQNLQKKLEETMNLFKLSKAASEYEN